MIVHSTWPPELPSHWSSKVTFELAKAALRDLAVEPVPGASLEEFPVVGADLAEHADLEKEDIIVRIRVVAATLRAIPSTVAERPIPLGVERRGRLCEDDGSRILPR